MWRFPVGIGYMNLELWANIRTQDIDLGVIGIYIVFEKKKMGWMKLPKEHI